MVSELATGSAAEAANAAARDKDSADRRRPIYLVTKSSFGL
jgi:hypothetical protein